MKNLSLPAKAYITLTVLVGTVILGWNLVHLDREDIWLTLLLSAMASISLIFKVEGSTNRSHYNISFVIYGFTFILLGPEATILVILIANFAEWVWYRYPWYIPSFNICSHVLVLHLTGMIYRWINPLQNNQGLESIASILLSMAFFTVLNHFLIGLVIWLARGESFTKSGIFDFFPLMLDYTVLCMGTVAAMIWLFNPYAVVLFLLPLYPIYSTLKVPALERKTETDAKTGLYNATYFEQALVSELKRADRFDRPLTVVMADLDLLRNINNTYGHLAGDEVLKGIAEILKTSVREYDVVARFGGEEFSILIPETTPQQAYPRIEAIRNVIERSDFIVPTSVTPIRATMSFGISGRQGSMNSPQEIIHNADAALYHAKLKGRNGTFIYSEEGIFNLFNHAAAEDLERMDLDPEPHLNLEIPPEPAVSAQSFQAESPVPQDVQPNSPGVPRKRSKWWVNVYITSLVMVGAALYAFTYRPVWEVNWIGVAIFAIMVILTEWLSIDIYDARGTAVSTSTVPMLAGNLLFGPIAALVTSLTLATVALFKYRSPISRLFFNASNQLISALIYLALIQATGDIFIHQPIMYQFLFCLMAVGITYLFTTSMISIGISLDTRTSLREIWREQFSWLAPYYLVMGLIAYTLVFSFRTAGLTGTIITLVPLLLLRFSQMQYIERTKMVVQEIREKNTALQKSSFEIQRLNDGLMDTLAEVVDLRDPHVLGHSKQVARYAELMAKKLGLHPRQVELVRKSGLLHDIGKLGISEKILFKPDRLTSNEHNVVKQHSNLGADLLENSRTLKELIPIIRHHHEYFDGCGYPDGLQGSDIPIEARILAVADAVEAMATDRPYRHGMSTQEILDELNDHSGTQFDPRIVKAFTQVIRSGSESVIVNSARSSIGDEKSSASEVETRGTYPELRHVEG